MTPSTTRLVFPVRALRQALGIAVVPSGAVLAVACDDGLEETALALALSDTSISFSDVTACGPAALTLTVTTGSDNVTTDVGTATAELTPGEVHVDFAGPLYGELIIASSSSPLICTGLGDPVTVHHSLAIALAIGPYALTCTDDGGFSASARVTVVAAARTPVALSFAAPTPSLVSLDVEAVGGQFFTPFVFVPGQATYALVATQATSQIVVSGLGEPSGAILAVNGDSRLPLTLAWSSASIDIVTVRAPGKPTGSPTRVLCSRAAPSSRFT